MCLEVSVQRKSCPTARCYSGFFYPASDFCSYLARQASAVSWGNSNYGRIVINHFLLIKKGLGLVEMTCGLVHASYSLPE